MDKNATTAITAAREMVPLIFGVEISVAESGEGRREEDCVASFVSVAAASCFADRRVDFFTFDSSPPLSPLLPRPAPLCYWRRHGAKREIAAPIASPLDSASSRPSVIIGFEISP